MNSHLWKLPIAAGLIWLAVLVQHQLAAVAEPAPVEPVSSPRPTSALAARSEPTPIPASSAGSANPTPTLPGPTTPLPFTPTPNPIFHIVLPGEVPSIIAEQYGISAETLMQFNDIDDPTTLQIGQQLAIPVTPTPTPRFSPTPTPSPVSYTVKEGDVLLDIAAEFETTTEAIMIANGITNPRTLQIGQQLLIPKGNEALLGVQTVIYAVESGDTLLGLASLFGSTVNDILEANPTLEPTRLQVGKEIIIPITQQRPNPAANPTLPRLTIPSALPPALQTLEQKIFAGINAQRQGQGLNPYLDDAQLNQVALVHAQDMVSRGYFGHVTPEGVTVRGRTEEHGLFVNWVGENIQRNLEPYEQTAENALNWWMNSRVHRLNILHQRYTRIGIGIAEGPPGWYTYVLVFAGD